MCANFELLSLNFVRECTNTKQYFIQNLVEIDQREPLNLRRISVFFYRDIKFSKFDVSTELPR